MIVASLGWPTICRWNGSTIYLNFTYVNRAGDAIPHGRPSDRKFVAVFLWSRNKLSIFLEAFSRRSPLTFRTTFDNKPTREILLKTVVVTAIGKATTFIEDGMGWDGDQWNWGVFLRLLGRLGNTCVLTFYLLTLRSSYNGRRNSFKEVKYLFNIN